MSGLYPVRVKCMLKGCPSCGASFPVNGLVSETICPSCQTRVPIPEEVWAEAFDGIDADTLCDAGSAGSKDAASFASGYDLHVDWRRVGAPVCLGCGAALALPVHDAAAPSTQQTCPRCREVADFHSPPFEVSFGGPPVALVLAPERDTPQGAPPPVPSGGGAAPVVMSCPKCGGGLELDDKSTRTVPCSYCGAAVFLPDELWRTLHPVKRAVPWIAVFQVTADSLKSVAKGHWVYAIPITLGLVGTIAFAILAVYQVSVRGYDFGFYLLAGLCAAAAVVALVGVVKLLAVLRGYSDRAAALGDDGR